MHLSVQNAVHVTPIFYCAKTEACAHGRPDGEAVAKETQV